MWITVPPFGVIQFNRHTRAPSVQTAALFMAAGDSECRRKWIFVLHDDTWGAA